MFIKQILKQKDENIKMWGFEYKTITLVAVVRTIEHSSTKITYELSDITGEFWRMPCEWVVQTDPRLSKHRPYNAVTKMIGIKTNLNF